MRLLFVCLILLLPVLVSAQEAKKATILLENQNNVVCEGETEWVEEIGDCAFVEHEVGDIDLSQVQAQAEGFLAKIKSWQEGLKKWKETCFAPLATVDTTKSKGSIQTLKGNVFVNRGVDTIIGREGMELLPGDVVRVDESSEVTLDLRDSGVLSITQPTNFQIPRTESDNPGFFTKTKLFVSSVWNRGKRCLQGDVFKDPGILEGGVRG